MLYASADIGFVGGSMVPVGGHNILEPLAVGLPVLFGPYMVNFKEIADRVLRVEAAVQCRNEVQIIEAVKRFYEDLDFRQTVSRRGIAFLKGNQGATKRVAAMLEQYISQRIEQLN